jgi:hypothetical protein
VLEAVGEAVAELNQHDLLHRDLKPSNVVLTSEGRIVLTDFGLACTRPAAGYAGGVAGTPAYMAPEMFDGIISTKTDVYALGMTAYHVLSGRTAFSGNRKEQDDAIAVDVKPLIAAGVPQGVIDVVVRATNKDPLFRAKSAWHVVQSLRAAFNAAGIKAATQDQLARKLKDKPEQIVAAHGTTSADPSSGSSSATIADLAARKRNQRPPSAIDTAARHSPPAWTPTTHAAGPAATDGAVGDRRRARMAGLAGSLAGAAVGVLGAIFIRRFDAGLTDWVDAHFTHRFLVNMFHAPGILVAPIAPAIEITIVIGGCLGSAFLLYRYLRGVRRPRNIERTQCGWCGHELRGITEPVCPECGHKIGDRGPDKDGLLPPGLTRNRKVAVSMGFFCAVTSIVADAMATWALRALNQDPADLIIFPFALFFGCAAALLVYEVSAQRDLLVSGRAWCRVCGSELIALTEPVCPTCHTKI